MAAISPDVRLEIRRTVTSAPALAMTAKQVDRGLDYLDWLSAIGPDSTGGFDVSGGAALVDITAKLPVVVGSSPATVTEQTVALHDLVRNIEPLVRLIVAAHKETTRGLVRPSLSPLLDLLGMPSGNLRKALVDVRDMSAHRLNNFRNEEHVNARRAVLWGLLFILKQQAGPNDAWAGAAMPSEAFSTGSETGVESCQASLIRSWIKQ